MKRDLRTYLQNFKDRNILLRGKRIKTKAVKRNTLKKGNFQADLIVYEGKYHL